MRRNIFIWTAMLALSVGMCVAQNNDPWGDDAYGLRSRKNKSHLSTAKQQKQQSQEDNDWYFRDDPYTDVQQSYPPVSDAELDAYNRRVQPDSLKSSCNTPKSLRKRGGVRTVDGYYTQRLSRFYDHDIAVRNVDEVNIYLSRFSPYGYEEGYYNDGSTFANIYVNNRGGYYYDDPMMYDPYYVNSYYPWYTVPPYGGYWGYMGYYPYPTGWGIYFNWPGGWGGWSIGWNGPYWGYGWGSYYGWGGYYGWPGYWASAGYGWGYYDGFYNGYNSYRYDNYRHGSYSNGYYGRSNYGNSTRSTQINRGSNTYSRSRYEDSAQAGTNRGSYNRSSYDNSRSGVTISRPSQTIIERYDRSNTGRFGSPSRSTYNSNNSSSPSRGSYNNNNSYNRNNNNRSYNSNNYNRSYNNNSNQQQSQPSRSTYNSNRNNNYSTPSRSTYNNNGGGSYSSPSRSNGGGGGGSTYRRR